MIHKYTDIYCFVEDILLKHNINFRCLQRLLIFKLSCRGRLHSETLVTDTQIRLDSETKFHTAVSILSSQSLKKVNLKDTVLG